MRLRSWKARRSWKTRSKRTLIAAALTTTIVAGTAGWAVGNEQQPLTGPPPGTQAWRADHTWGVRLPDPATASPARVAAFFDSLSEAQQHSLATRHPSVVGNLDGAPTALRFEANSLSLKAERARERARLSDPSLTLQDHERARSLVTRYEQLLAPDRQILAFDPRGRGQVAAVYGDLTGAKHVSVVVPGSDIDLSTFDRSTDEYGTPAGMARSLHAAAGNDTAVVAWVGYTTPVGLGPDAATGRLAQAGAPRLARFVQGLTASGTPRPAVFCHSYGSVVCGLAAPQLTASDLVVLGSPGMRADSVADLHTSARVWAAKDDSDWIGDVPNVELFGLGHGEDPADPAFGARRVPAERAEGHTGYFAPGTDSLKAFASIAEPTAHGTPDNGTALAAPAADARPIGERP
ncbi:alpha/beta hydrolase [Streptomyces durmitorensis]|uniref:Alpha/beta hydrolase family protein n=1 Tax=Streptomyces durmitorensis TaxID=319947 RepID=A0ABY4PZA2_9ACTN|nr:alpha/beta hydrolase [Streptomyces durmitorensis]UQT58762.1 alpha/beta hydrolase family protein [Streptomyces durmitorensis]